MPKRSSSGTAGAELAATVGVGHAGGAAGFGGATGAGRGVAAVTGFGGSVDGVAGLGAAATGFGAAGFGAAGIGAAAAGAAGAGAGAPGFAGSLLRNNPRATRNVPLVCSMFMGLVRTRFAPMRNALATPA